MIDFSLISISLNGFDLRSEKTGGNDVDWHSIGLFIGGNLSFIFTVRRKMFIASSIVDVTRRGLMTF